MLPCYGGALVKGECIQKGPLYGTPFVCGCPAVNRTLVQGCYIQENTLVQNPFFMSGLLSWTTSVSGAFSLGYS